jgi:hypothetical protein
VELSKEKNEMKFCTLVTHSVESSVQIRTVKIQHMIILLTNIGNLKKKNIIIDTQRNQCIMMKNMTMMMMMMIGFH